MTKENLMQIPSLQFDTYLVVESAGIIELFENVFTVSEGQEEGRVIAGLVSDLLRQTEPQQLSGFVCLNSGKLIGCIFFSQLILSSGKNSFLLSPVAVSTMHQGNGVGQQLIRYGLDQLLKNKVELVFTYGDPTFYSKVGFEEISEDIVSAPRKLSYPGGWLAQSLTGEKISPETGVSICVDALDKQQYW